MHYHLRPTVVSPISNDIVSLMPIGYTGVRLILSSPEMCDILEGEAMKPASQALFSKLMIPYPFICGRNYLLMFTFRFYMLTARKASI